MNEPGTMANDFGHWITAFAGMTGMGLQVRNFYTVLDSCFRRNDGG